MTQFKWRKYNICNECASSPEVMDPETGSPARFCQQCRKMQPLGDFAFRKKSCRQSLLVHSAMQRFRRNSGKLPGASGESVKDGQAQAQAAANSPKQEQPQNAQQAVVEHLLATAAAAANVVNRGDARMSTNNNDSTRLVQQMKMQRTESLGSMNSAKTVGDAAGRREDPPNTSSANSTDIHYYGSDGVDNHRHVAQVPTPDRYERVSMNHHQHQGDLANFAFESNFANSESSLEDYLWLLTSGASNLASKAIAEWQQQQRIVNGTASYTESLKGALATATGESPRWATRTAMNNVSAATTNGGGEYNTLTALEQMLLRSEPVTNSAGAPEELAATAVAAVQSGYVWIPQSTFGCEGGTANNKLRCY